MKTKKKRQLKKSQRASKVYNTLPIEVTRQEFNSHIKKHLSKGKRGVKPKLSQFDIFNHILYVLHTGIPWYRLPEKKIHWSNVYKHHNKWSKDGSYEKIFNQSLLWLKEKNKLDLQALHGDGSNVVAKKGVKT